MTPTKRGSVEELLKRYPERVKQFADRGCGYWKTKENQRVGCTFPQCWCYPTWKGKYVNPHRKRKL